jgi:rhodanese-related sulfurtransferase|tara:strand:- start:76 stop:315 length:240 start_codon:yes stop_codon:yes gene_type:complete
MADIGRKMVEIAQGTVSSMPATDVNTKMETGEPFVVLDVREPDEWANGHIEGAILLSRGRIEGRLEELVPDKDTPIVTH